MTETRIIEIEGVKLEVDLTTAKTIETYRIGDNVKVLVKKWDKKYDVFPGVLLAFDDFPTKPTITVGYFEEGSMKRAHIHADTKGVEIAPLRELDIPFQKADVLKRMDRAIQTKEQELEKLRWERTYFDECFARYFADASEEEAATA